MSFKRSEKFHPCVNSLKRGAVRAVRMDVQSRPLDYQELRPMGRSSLSLWTDCMRTHWEAGGGGVRQKNRWVRGCFFFVCFPHPQSKPIKDRGSRWGQEPGFDSFSKRLCAFVCCAVVNTFSSLVPCPPHTPCRHKGGQGGSGGRGATVASSNFC